MEDDFDNMAMSASHCATKTEVIEAKLRLETEGPFFAVDNGTYPGVYSGVHMAAYEYTNVVVAGETQRTRFNTNIVFADGEVHDCHSSARDDLSNQHDSDKQVPTKAFAQSGGDQTPNAHFGNENPPSHAVT